MKPIPAVSEVHNELQTDLKTSDLSEEARKRQEWVLTSHLFVLGIEMRFHCNMPLDEHPELPEAYHERPHAYLATMKGHLLIGWTLALTNIFQGLH